MAIWDGKADKNLTFGRRISLRPVFKRKPMELKEGLIPVVKAETDCDVYCPICHKLLHVKAGEVIPRCCGKVMEKM